MSDVEQLTMGYLSLWKRMRGPRPEVPSLMATARGSGDS